MLHVTSLSVNNETGALILLGSKPSLFVFPLRLQPSAGPRESLIQKQDPIRYIRGFRIIWFTKVSRGIMVVRISKGHWAYRADTESWT